MQIAQTLLLIDACRNDPTGRSDTDNRLSKEFADALRFDVRNREVNAFAVLFAASIGQRAYEYIEKKQGYFTWALVQGLRGEAANAVGDITLSSLLSYIQTTVPKRVALDFGSRSQRPYAVIEGYRAEALILATVPNVVPDSSREKEGTPPPPPTPESEAEARTRLAKAREAIGGDTKLAGIKDVTLEFQKFLPRIGGGFVKTVKTTQKYCGGTIRAEQRLLLREVLTVYFDGTGGWMRSGGKSEPLAGAVLEVFQAQQFLLLFDLVRADLRGDRIEVIGPATVRVTNPSGRSAEIEFDSQTHLPRALRFKTAHTIFSDWRKVDGVIYPFEQSIVIEKERPVLEKALSIKINRGIRCADLAKQ
jgi:hypothetical protein